MSEESTDASDEGDVSGDDDSERPFKRERLEEGAERAVAEFDERTVDILSWVLDTETRARIYVYLRQHPRSTSEEVADGTGLYPSTVREALAGLADEGKVSRRKRESEGAGNNPYEYTAMAPSELVGEIVGQIQDELNALCNLDDVLGEERSERDEPVHIEVEYDERADDSDGSPNPKR